MSARVIVVTSGKGGVGKTTTTANIDTGLQTKVIRFYLLIQILGLETLMF